MAMKRYTSVDDYIDDQTKFVDILNHLRNLISTTEVEETVKWGMPVYTIKNKNVLGISAFKNHSGMWFYQGALLSDPLNVLINAQEGKTQAMRQWRFKEKSQLNDEQILQYILEAIENEKQGKRVKFEKKKIEVTVPDPLMELFSKDTRLKESFDLLTPGKQKEYCEYISTAKREATVQSRLQKISPMIRNGVGLNDMYKR